MRPARRIHWFHSKVQEAWTIGLTRNDGKDVKGGRAGKMAQWLKRLAAKLDGLAHFPGGGENQLSQVVLDLYRGTDRLVLDRMTDGGVAPVCCLPRGTHKSE